MLTRAIAIRRVEAVGVEPQRGGQCAQLRGGEGAQRPRARCRCRAGRVPHRSASDDVVTSFARSDCYRLERQLPGGIRTR